MLVLTALLALSSLHADLPVRDTVLSNGLRILVHPRPSSPVVACRIFYATGSIHEAPGRTGIAHMVEHMLFKGTERVGTRDPSADSLWMPVVDRLDSLWMEARDAGDTARASGLRESRDSALAAWSASFVRDELWTTLREAGGTGLNAFTTDLGTAYFVTLPRERFELFLWLEADRMTETVFREFPAERDVVREERRLRFENRPSGRYWETLQEMVWEAHPYQNPTIGWPSDIDRYTRAMAQEHYERYYGPANAVLVLAGGVDPDTAFALAARHFGGIEKGVALPAVNVREPDPAGQKRLHTVRDDATPSVDLLFVVPPIYHRDAPVLEVASGVLGGDAGRLERLLVDSLRLATSVGASHLAQRDHGLFWVGATPAPGVPLAQVEEALWNALQGVADSLPEREIQRVRRRLALDRLAGLRSLEHVATELGFSALHGDWRLVHSFPQAVTLVEPASVKAAVTRHLRAARATVGWLRPSSHPERTMEIHP